MHVTRAQPTDVPRAAPLFAAYRVFYGMPHDVEASAAFLAERLARDESIVLLASEGDTTVGLVQVYPAFSSSALAPIWILNDLYVLESSRGTGVVDALIDEVVRLATAAGCVAVELATQHTNRRAQAVYERSGFAVDREFLHYERPLP